MTRFARGSNSNKKKVHEASSWKELNHSQTNSETNNRWQQQHKNDNRVFKKSHPFRKSNTFPRRDSYEKQKKLKDAFVKSSNPEEKDVAEIFWKTERSDQRRLKRIQERQQKKVCYNCREPGHVVSECPEVRRDVDQGTGICFKCGSTEHSSGQCTAKVKPGTYPFAKCFVCGEMGHITKQCPDNPRGLYPNGGCCMMCGSVEHFKKDCPRYNKQRGIQDVTLDRMSTLKSADDEPVILKPKISSSSGAIKKPKVVKF